MTTLINKQYLCKKQNNLLIALPVTFKFKTDLNSSRKDFFKKINKTINKDELILLPFNHLSYHYQDCLIIYPETEQKITINQTNPNMTLITENLKAKAQIEIG